MFKSYTEGQEKLTREADKRQTDQRNKQTDTEDKLTICPRSFVHRHKIVYMYIRLILIDKKSPSTHVARSKALSSPCLWISFRQWESGCMPRGSLLGNIHVFSFQTTNEGGNEGSPRKLFCFVQGQRHLLVGQDNRHLQYTRQTSHVRVTRGSCQEWHVCYNILLLAYMMFIWWSGQIVYMYVLD